MKKIRIGIICPSEIAFRRFLPSLEKEENFTYVGVAIASKEEWDGDVADTVIENEWKKGKTFVDTYGGKIFESYSSLIMSNEVDAVYLPLPPALHYKWAKKALENDKHVFVEKPSTTNYQDSLNLVKLAEERKLVLHENYMFQYHSQISEIKKEVENGKIGKVHSYHARFGFPRRDKNDFRYNKELGGGALLDAGGYVIKLATRLLGEDITLESCVMNSYEDFDVDLYGSYMFRNKKNEVFIGEYGMDCEYQCMLSIWGSKGIMQTDRIFTAPDNFKPSLKIIQNGEVETLELNCDSHFRKSIRQFYNAINDTAVRDKIYNEILLQAQLVQKVRDISGGLGNDKI